MSVQHGDHSSMSLPPVIERELRVAFRKLRPLQRRLNQTAAWAGATAFFILFGALGSSSWAKTLHWVLFVCGLFTVLRALPVSARLFAEDRRSQTLELLFLTGMTAPQLFIAKVIGGLLIASSDLLALMPFLSIPFLAGGLSLQLFLATVVTLPALLIFMVALGVLASVITSDEGSATLTAAVLLALLCLLVPVPYGLGLAVTGQPPFSSFWLCASPAYAPWLIDRSFGLAFPPEFWLAGRPDLCLGIFLLRLRGHCPES